MKNTEQTDLIQIGDYVRIDAVLYDSPNDILGSVIGVYPHHYLIKSDKGLNYSVKKMDRELLTVMIKAKYLSYSEESFKRDFAEATL